MMSLIRMLRRPSVRKFTLALCACYMLVVFFFHARLQFRVPPIAQDAEDLVPGHAEVHTSYPTSRRLDLTRVTQRSTMGPPSRSTMAPLHIDNKTPVNRTRNIGDLFAREPKCVGVKASNKFGFQTITRGVVTYSAYWDERQNDFDNRYDGVKIRIMAFVQGKRYRPTIRCMFDVEGQERSTLVTYYEMCENHNRRWGGFIMSCEVPSEIQKQVPCSVRLVESSTATAKSVYIPVHNLTPTNTEEERYKYAMCVPPLFGNVSNVRVIEFIEMSMTLGAEHIMMYNFSVNAAINSTLQHYVDAGRLTVIPWEIPSDIDKTSWYHGQIVAVQDCLYRHMGQTEFVTFNDIDEFIVPRQGSTWYDIVSAMDNDRICGLKFKSAFFNPRSPLLPPLDPNVQQIPGLILAVNQRSSMMSHVRTKCMVKPQKIFEMGIHHISKPILASLGGVNVDPTLAVLHHYRPCLAGFGMQCRDQVQDDTALRYGPNVYARVKTVLSKTGKHGIYMENDPRR